MLGTKYCRLLFFGVGVCLLSGCIGSRYIKSDYVEEPSSAKAYVIAKQTIGDGNLDRIGMTLFVNKKLRNKDTRGIQIDGVKKALPIVSVYGALKKVSEDDASAYQVWEVPAKMFKKAGKSIMYVRNIESRKLYVFGLAAPTFAHSFNSPFECMLLFFPDPSGKRNKGVQAFTADRIADVLMFKHLVKEPFPGADFFGNTFTIDQAGVYYVGDITVGAELTYEKRDWFLGNDATSAKNVSVKADLNPDAAKAYAEEIGLGDLPFYDNSSTWEDKPMGDLRLYFTE